MYCVCSLQPFVCLFSKNYLSLCCLCIIFCIVLTKGDETQRGNLQLLSLFKVDARRLTEQERERKREREEKKKKEKEKRKKKTTEEQRILGEQEGRRKKKQSQGRTSLKEEKKSFIENTTGGEAYAFVYQEGSISSSSLSSIISLLNFFWTSSRYFSSSSLATKAMARPLVPKRPARPIRWRYSSLLS